MQTIQGVELCSGLFVRSWPVKSFGRPSETSFSVALRRVVPFFRLSLQATRAMSGHARPRALVAVANGSEDIETVTTVDILRRASVEVCASAVIMD